MTSGGIDIVVKGMAGAVTGVLAALVLSGGPRRTANVFLALFLALIAGNLLADAAVEAADTPRDAIFWSRVGSVFSAVDPFVLYYFAAVFPERSSLARPVRLGCVAAPALFFVATVLWRFPNTFLDPRSVALSLGYAVYAAVVYAVVLVRFAGPLRAGRAGHPYRFLYPAACIAAVPAIARVFEVGVFAGRVFADVGTVTPATRLVVTLAPTVMAVSALAALGRGGVARGTPERRGLLWGPWAALAVVAVSSANRAIVVAQQAGAAVPASWLAVFPDSPGPAFKWIAFSVLGMMALLRHDVLGMSLAARRRAARVAVATGFVAVAFVAVVALPLGQAETGRPFTAGDVVVLAVALLLSQGFLFVVARVASSVFGVPATGHAAAAMDAYRAAVEQTVREGRFADNDAQLARLRSELALDPRVAAVVERMAASSANVAIVPGETVAGRYRVVRSLGRSGSGRAFLARDELLERDVVVKEILHGGAGREGALREARVGGALGHPNVVAVHDVLERPGSSLLVTEFVAGGSLADRPADGRAFALPEGLRVFDGILAGLEALHGRGFVHGDLSPSNILLTDAGVAKLADFGLAQAIGTRALSELGLPTPAATPGYAAPELLQGDRPSPRSDVYAAGILMRAFLRGPVPEAVSRVMLRATAAQPGLRHAGAGELRADLRRAATAVLRPEHERAMTDAHDVTGVQRLRTPRRKALEVQEGPVPAGREVLEAERAAVAAHPGVVRADEGVEVQGHVGVPPAPDHPGRGPVRGGG